MPISLRTGPPHSGQFFEGFISYVLEPIEMLAGLQALVFVGGDQSIPFAYQVGVSSLCFCGLPAASEVWVGDRTGDSCSPAN